jgi:hypothetical protein
MERFELIGIHPCLLKKIRCSCGFRLTPTTGTRLEVNAPTRTPPSPSRWQKAVMTLKILKPATTSGAAPTEAEGKKKVNVY